MSIQHIQQSWVRLTSHKHGMDPRNDFLNKHSISVPNGIVELQKSRPFYLLYASFGRRPYFIPRSITVVHLMESDDNLLHSSSLTISELLYIVLAASDGAKKDCNHLLAAELQTFKDLWLPTKVN